jgi:hypothetical protein
LDKDVLVKLIDSLSDIDRNRFATVGVDLAPPSADYVEKLIDKIPAFKFGS